jgi:hypothetical protein
VEGWIKLHRKLLENPIFQNEKLLKVFVWCLLKASHTEHAELVGLQKVSLRPGQFVYGRHKAAEELKIKESTLYKYMMWLKNEEILNIQSNNKFSVVTVVNWDLYQMDESKSNSKNSSKVTTKEQQRNTNKNDKNDKNNKNNIFIPPTLEEVISYCKERNNSVDPQKWYDFYSAKGWMIGKNKMKDWKAAVRTWERGCDSKPQKSKYRDMTNYQPGE